MFDTAAVIGILKLCALKTYKNYVESGFLKKLHDINNFSIFIPRFISSCEMSTYVSVRFGIRTSNVLELVIVFKTIAYQISWIRGGQIIHVNPGRHDDWIVHDEFSGGHGFVVPARIGQPPEYFLRRQLFIVVHSFATFVFSV